MAGVPYPSQWPMRLKNSSFLKKSWLWLIPGICVAGCDTSRTESRGTTPKDGSAATAKSSLDEKTIAKIERFCGDCHPLPIPSTFPKENWAAEVRQGFKFYIESKRTDLPEPIQRDVIRYYEERANDVVVVPRADTMFVPPSPVRFEPSEPIATGDVAPATAHLVWQTTERSLLFTDMYSGTLKRWSPGPTEQSISSIPSIPIQAGKPDASAFRLIGTRLAASSGDSTELIAQGRNFCRVVPFDWDGDGHMDYILGEMGSFRVGDHENGRVSIHFGGDNPQSLVIAEGLGRTVEAKPFDYDLDGDLDLVVIDFGWRDSGSVKLLRNQGGEKRSPNWNLEVIDDRHGALGVEFADLDRDGKMDFVVAFAQEYETVEAFLQQENGRYEKQVILQLPDPSYNSSAFQLVDLDRDGLIDVVHTCGDVMDSLLPKPYHGLRWVKNLGGGKWENRELGLLVGALQSAVADFDGDGDLDIACVGLFPHGGSSGPGAFDSICWWEQRTPDEFIRHSIERDRCSHAACVAADVDGDSRIDLVVGEWLDDKQKGAFRVFRNLPAALVLGEASKAD
ncbi:FG-GAP repeat domain-containing protein [Pirellulaceae bacterium SH501]